MLGKKRLIYCFYSILISEQNISINKKYVYMQLKLYSISIQIIKVYLEIHIYEIKRAFIDLYRILL